MSTALQYLKATKEKNKFSIDFMSWMTKEDWMIKPKEKNLSEVTYVCTQKVSQLVISLIAHSFQKKVFF